MSELRALALVAALVALVFAVLALIASLTGQATFPSTWFL